MTTTANKNKNIRDFAFTEMRTNYMKDELKIGRTKEDGGCIIDLSWLLMAHHEFKNNAITIYNHIIQVYIYIYRNRE